LTNISEKTIITTKFQRAVNHNKNERTIMDENTQKQIDKFRTKIDDIDLEIIDAINRRTEVVLEIGKIKEQKNAKIYVPGRENQVYKKAFSVNKGPIKNSSLQAIYREIMSASLALEKKITIGFLGPEGSYSHQATIQKFGSSLPFMPLRTISDVFKAVATGECDYSVVPVENSTEGGVNHTLEMFIDTDIKICSEILVPIKHNLMNKSGDIKQIKQIYSNPQVLAQCRQWLITHLPDAELVEVSSSSRAAQMCNEDENAAAIGSLLCSQIYKLELIHDSIQDIPNNFTRFTILSTDYPGITGDDKTSLLVDIKDKVGALYDTLLYFKNHGLNLTRIESRPSKKRPWEYYFYIDFIGHYDDPAVKDLIENLKEHCESVKLLGSYPIYHNPSESETNG